MDMQEIEKNNTKKRIHTTSQWMSLVMDKKKKNQIQIR